MEFLLDVFLILALMMQVYAFHWSIQVYTISPSSIYLYFSLYIALSLLQSTVGIILAFCAIHTTPFYILSDVMPHAAYILFAYHFFKEKRKRKFVLMLGFISLIYYASTLVNLGSSKLFYQFKIPDLIEIILSVNILNSRLKNNESLPFIKDSWSKISAVLVVTLTLSIISLAAFQLSISLHLIRLYDTFFRSMNCISVMVRYGIIGFVLYKEARTILISKSAAGSIFN